MEAVIHGEIWPNTCEKQRYLALRNFRLRENMPKDGVSTVFGALKTIWPLKFNLKYQKAKILQNIGYFDKPKSAQIACTHTLKT